MPNLARVTPDFDLIPVLQDLTRPFNETLDAHLVLDIPSSLLVSGDATGIQESIRLLIISLLPLSNPPGRGTLRAQERNGWVQVEINIPGNPFRSEELADLVEHCHGRRFAGRHLFRPELSRNLDQARKIAEAHGGRLSLTSSQAFGTVIALTLPASS